MLKSQMEADRKSFEAVSDENRKLMGVIEELNTKIRNLQGEVAYTHDSNCDYWGNVRVAVKDALCSLR